MNFYTFIVVSLIFLNFGDVECVSIEKDLSLTLQQKQTLDKFRVKVAPLLKNAQMKTDIYLIRWLRARNFNLDAAETMLKENLRWRKANNMDSIHLENFEDMMRDYPAIYDKTDKQGRPMAELDISIWDIRAAVLEGRGPRLLRYLDRLMENVTTQVFEKQAKGMNVSQWTVIANCETFNMINHGCPVCIPIWIQFVNSLENHFAGWMNELITIDSPQAVRIVLDIVRPFLHQLTRDAIHILPQNKNKWMAYLDERISKENRTPLYGGTRDVKKF